MSSSDCSVFKTSIVILSLFWSGRMVTFRFPSQCATLRIIFAVLGDQIDARLFWYDLFRGIAATQASQLDLAATAMTSGVFL